MSNELENLILTIDSHEQANSKEKTRIKAIEQWAEKYGICAIEHKELELCDYSLIGEFREYDINLGIEYKTWDNFLSDPTDDMEDKITRSKELYDEVAFFVETGNYTFKPHEDDCHCTLQFSDMAKAGFRKKGITELPATKTLAGFEGFLETMSLNGVHVRQLRSEAQFPYSLHNLLIYLSNSPHILKVKELSYEQWLINHYMNLPEIGYIRAKKLVLNYPNPSWICSASEESLISVLGKTTGRVIFQNLHSHTLETDAWKQGFHADGTPRLDDGVCESIACQVAGNDSFPCDMKGFDKVCRYPELKMKLAKERGYPSKKKTKKEKAPAESKPCKDKTHQDFKIWKAKGFKSCAECQHFSTNEKGVTVCLKHSDYVVYVTTHACIEHQVKDSSYPPEASHSPPNTSEVNTPGQETKGSPGVSPNNSIIVLECEECGDNSLYVPIDPILRLCPTCKKEADRERHEQLVEIAKEIIRYMAGYPDGLNAQEICDNYDCGESSADKKDLLICLKKMAQVGLITSKYKGIFTVAPKGLTFAGVTDNSQSLGNGQNDCTSAKTIATDNNSSHTDVAISSVPDLQAISHTSSPIQQQPVEKAEGLSFSSSAVSTLKACKNLNCLNNTIPDSEYCDSPECVHDRACQEAEAALIKRSNSPEVVKARLDELEPRHPPKPKLTRSVRKQKEEPKITSAAPITDLTLGLKEWFDTAHNMQETIDNFRAWGNGEAIFNKIVELTNANFLRRYTDKRKGMMWIQAVKADTEYDIGV